LGIQLCQKKKTKKLKKILEEHAYEHKVTKEDDEKESLWKVRQSSAGVLWQSLDGAKAIPIVEDAVVPADKLAAFMRLLYRLFETFNLDVSVWGHAGEGQLHVQPFINLQSVGDRQKIFKLIDKYNDLVIQIGGSPSAAHNDGRLRGPYLNKLYDEDMYKLFQKIKKIFDPHGILNPGVKIDVDQKELEHMIRHDYSMHHLYDHLPRT